MRVPYIKVKQKSEEFFVVKFKANDLRERVNFHFREPYMNTKKEMIDYNEYIEKLRRIKAYSMLWSSICNDCNYVLVHNHFSMELYQAD